MKIKSTIIMFFVMAALMSSTGCSTIQGWFDNKPNNENASSEFPKGTIFFRKDVSSWPKTAILLANISSSGKTISIDSNKKNIWPAKTTAEGKGCNANAWIIFEYNGQWYAGTWEWLRTGATSKTLKGALGSYIKATQIPNNWNPAKGQKIGLMVSGLARDAQTNVQERSNIVWLVWP